MNSVYLCENAFTMPDVPEQTPLDIVTFLMKKWTRMPANAVIYHNRYAETHRVICETQADVDYLCTLTGRFYVVQNAGDPTTAAYALFALLAVVAVVASRVNVPFIEARNQQAGSPNNELSDRQNRIRLNGRIPDIYGSVLATPDLISVPYFVYNADHRKIEHAYLCFGRGSFEFATRGDTYEIYDGDTLVKEIEGASVAVYGPNTSFNYGSPQLSIGAVITEPIYAAKKIDAVNGQTLLAPNETDVSGEGAVMFGTVNSLYADPGSELDFTVGITTSISVSVPQYDDRWYVITQNPGGEGYAMSWVDIPVTYNGTTGVFSWDAVPDGGIVYGISFIVAGSAIYLSGNDPTTGLYWSGTFLVTATTGYPGVPGSITVHLPGYVSAALAALTGTSYLMNVTGNSTIVNMNFSGTYPVTSVGEKTVVLTDPISVNGAWYWAPRLGGSFAASAAIFPEGLGTVVISGMVEGVVNNWIGPFTVNLELMDAVIGNFVASQGMYKDDGTDQTATDVDVEMELTPVSASGAATGSPILLTGTVEGTALTKDERALTVRNPSPLTATRYKVRARRVTPKDLAFSGQIVDVVKWADLYGLQSVSQLHFGDVTTARAMSTATTGALAIKSRKLSARLTRKVYPIQSDGTLNSVLTASTRMCDIMAAICTDPYIGNRTTAEVDLANLRATGLAVESYFGRVQTQQFCYTFDKLNMSFEETAEIVAEAVFSTVYREGPVIRMRFERTNSDAELSFVHRNKIPSTEKRTTTFGLDGNFDGVAVDYASPIDGAVLTYNIPTDGSAAKPKKLTYPGVADTLQAYFHAWRVWNRMQYQRTTVEFEGTQEADALLRNSLILVADNTRANVQDGEVRGKVGLVLTTSQPVDFEGGTDWFVFLQHIDGTIQSIGASAGATEYEITLDEEPSAALSLDPENYALSTYLLVCAEDTWPREFLVQERETQDNMISRIVAINYDGRYYTNDQDYYTGFVGEDGIQLILHGTGTAAELPLTASLIPGAAFAGAAAGTALGNVFTLDASLITTDLNVGSSTLTVDDVRIGSSGTARATATFKANGTTQQIAQNDGTTAGSNWYTPTTTGIGSGFEIKFSGLYGSISVSGALMDTWYPLSSDVSIFAQTGIINSGLLEAHCMAQIRPTGGAVAGTFFIDLYVEKT